MISLQGKTILVVDDELGYREVLADEFRMAGATVLDSENGTRAFEIVRAQKIDAVISDIRMAGGSGIHLLDQIKATNPSLPVVMLITGFSDLTPEEAYDKGADALFTKPCNLETLVESVYRALLPENARWVKAIDHLPEDLILELEAESLGGAIQARLLSIGRGGMFVALEGPPPEMGQRIDFRMKSISGSHKTFAGIGLCRWTRANPEPNLPRGMGIEFQTLTEESFQALTEVLKQVRPRAFIPKQPKKEPA